jgi:hypothetical protein
VFLDGLEAATISRRLGRVAPAGPYWAVADLEVTAEGVISVSPLDQVDEVAFPGP